MSNDQGYVLFCFLPKSDSGPFWDPSRVAAGWWSWRSHLFGTSQYGRHAEGYLCRRICSRTVYRRCSLLQGRWREPWEEWPTTQGVFVLASFYSVDIEEHDNSRLYIAPGEVPFCKWSSTQTCLPMFLPSPRLSVVSCIFADEIKPWAIDSYGQVGSIKITCPQDFIKCWKNNRDSLLGLYLPSILQIILMQMNHLIHS